MATTIKESDIDVIAKAMAEANRVGDEPVPDRDVELYRERARLFLAASTALASTGKSTTPVPDPNAGKA